jgi:hypothetical protein
VVVVVGATVEPVVAGGGAAVVAGARAVVVGGAVVEVELVDEAGAAVATVGESDPRAQAARASPAASRSTAVRRGTAPR